MLKTAPSRPMLHNADFLAEVRRYLIDQGVPAEHAVLRIRVQLEETGKVVTNLVAYPKSCVPAGAPPPADIGDFDPTPLQARVIQFLATGPKSAKQMREKIGGHLYDSPGGIYELIDAGIVEKKVGKYRLTENGAAIAAELGDEEPEE